MKGSRVPGVVATLVLLLCCGLCCYADESFSEDLLLKPLPDGSLLANLQFTTSWDIDLEKPSSREHYGLFPKSLGDVVRAFDVEQLQLSFAQGRWDSGLWGVPVLDAPHGAHLAASFLEDSDVDASWKRLRHALSGLFCASLDSLDEVLTVAPHFSFRSLLGDAYAQQLKDAAWRQGLQEYLEEEVEEVLEAAGDTLSDFLERNGFVEPTEEQKVLSSNMIRMVATSRARVADGSHAQSRVRVGALPAEAVCTENLTPFVKLLPGRDQAGLGRLLDPLSVYDVLFHAQATRFRYVTSPLCEGLETCGWTRMELVQSLEVVMDVGHRQTFGVAALFGEAGLVPSLLANGGSHVWVHEDEAIELVPVPHGHAGGLAYYDLERASDLRLAMVRRSPVERRQVTGAEVDVTAHKWLLGSGDERGTVMVEIRNESDQEVAISFLDQMPWLLPVYFHTLEVYRNGVMVPIPAVCSAWRLEPGVDHSVPSVVELEMRLPPHSKTLVVYGFDKGFIHWTEHPPDAHKGVDVPASCVTVYYDEVPALLQHTGLEWSPLRAPASPLGLPFERRVYTESLLVSLPLPDFSMPYNVITLTCTVFGIIFSAVLTATTRRHGYLRKGGDYSSFRFSTWFYRKIRDYVTK